MKSLILNHNSQGYYQNICYSLLKKCSKLDIFFCKKVILSYPFKKTCVPRRSNALTETVCP